jgi:hypothetical protein
VLLKGNLEDTLDHFTGRMRQAAQAAGKRSTPTTRTEHVSNHQSGVS